MTQTLISFLGRVPKSENGYRPTTYTFDGEPDEPTAFIGWTLRRRLQPDRLVILGTAGSMWDHLFEKDIVLGAQAEDGRLALQDATETKTVTEALLEPLIPLLAQQLGCEVRLVLIPYCRTEVEQLELLGIMAAEVNPGDQVHLDVTHGFRHLPMLALLSALHLRQVKKAEISGIWYGAYDFDTKESPVYNLAGLLHIADWVEALNTFDKDGDYGVFAALMQAPAPAAARLLQESAFYERTTRPGQARNKLLELTLLLDQQPLIGIGALFAPTLHARLSWHREDRLYLRQQALARLYLEHGDFLRAALLGFEAFITRLMQQQGMTNPDHWEQRETVKKEYEARNKTLHPRSDEYRRYCLLRDLRNHLAHGNMSPQAEIQKALASAEQLRDFLDDLLRRLLPNDITP